MQFILVRYSFKDNSGCIEGALFRKFRIDTLTQIVGGDDSEMVKTYSVTYLYTIKYPVSKLLRIISDFSPLFQDEKNISPVPSLTKI